MNLYKFLLDNQYNSQNPVISCNKDILLQSIKFDFLPISSSNLINNTTPNINTTNIPPNQANTTTSNTTNNTTTNTSNTTNNTTTNTSNTTNNKPSDGDNTVISQINSNNNKVNIGMKINTKDSLVLQNYFDSLTSANIYKLINNSLLFIPN